ncbi:MAG: hypothetical protein ACOCXQ_03675 [Patescibacteria group bacterium]
MKQLLKTLTIVSAFVITFWIGASTAQAQFTGGGSTGASGDADGITFIDGIIYDEGGNFIADADVYVQCGTFSIVVNSGPTGHYATAADQLDCNNGDTVTVTATKDGRTGSNSDTVALSGDAFIDVAIVDVVIQIPEFGLVTGGAALLSSAGSLAFLRRRKQT